MFKAISRFGSQVRSTIGVGFLANIFSSKSKQEYGEFNDETEEIFSDAHEDLDSIDGEPEEHTAIVETPDTRLSSVPLNKDTNNSTDNQDPNIGDKTDEKTVDDSIDSDSNGSIVSTDKCDPQSDTKDDQSTRPVFELSNTTSDSTDANICDTDLSDTKEHNANSKDDKKLTEEKNKSAQNGMSSSSSSTSVFKKVHRRINSYSQRQYAKFDNTKDDENDNKVTAEVSELPKDKDTSKTNNVPIEYETDHDDVDHLFADTKAKKKKKLTKKTKKAVRCSWKWLRRGFTMYGLSLPITAFSTSLSAMMATKTK